MGNLHFLDQMIETNFEDDISACHATLRYIASLKLSVWFHFIMFFFFLFSSTRLGRQTSLLLEMLREKNQVLSRPDFSASNSSEFSFAFSTYKDCIYSFAGRNLGWSCSSSATNDEIKMAACMGAAGFCRTITHLRWLLSLFSPSGTHKKRKHGSCWDGY